jgi:membrane-bound inhibitor of C-type lysozyme
MSNGGPFRVAAGAAALAAASLALAAAPAGAATNKCQKYTAKYAVAEQTRAAVVFTNRDGVAYGCLYTDGRLRRLPGPDGTDTNTLGVVSLAGPYVAYAVSNLEPAATVSTATVYVVNLTTGKPTVSNQDAYPVGLAPDDEFSFGVDAIALRSNGAVAWLTDASVNDAQNLVARRVGKKVTVLDRGADVRVGSLARSSKGTTIYWTRGSTAKSATLS